MTIYIVVTGVPFGDGLTAYGPFTNGDDAVAWAEAINDEWNIVVLHPPGTDDTTDLPPDPNPREIVERDEDYEGE